MIVVDEWRLLFIMVLVVVPENEGVFLAYKDNKASVTGIPRLSEETLQMFHENGFHAEIIARAARHEEECGIVLLDYTAFTNGSLFDALEKQYQNEAFSDNNSLPYLKYRKAAYKLASETARKKHLEEVSRLFSVYQNITPHYTGEGQLRFIILDAIAVGIGMALVYVVYRGVTGLINSFVYKNEVEGLEKELMDLRMDVEKVSKLLDSEISVTRFSYFFAQLREQILGKLEETLRELFNYGRIESRLISHDGDSGLLAAISDLMGEDRFNQSLLRHYYQAGGEAVYANVLSMNQKLIEAKVCYPITKNADVGYLLQVIPFGEFSRDESTFSWHLLNSHYLLPANMVVGNVSELATVENPREHCVLVSSIYLCRFESQSPGCALGQDRRHGCSVKTVNSSNARLRTSAICELQFTIVNPLLRSSVVATRLKTILYKKSEADVNFEHMEVKKPVFAVELPKRAEMYIGDQTIRSRITSANLTLDVKMTYPVFNETLSPIFVNDGEGRNAMRQWWRRNVVGNEAVWIVAILAIVFNIGVLVYLLYTSHWLKVETKKLTVWKKIMDNYVTSKQTVEAMKRIKFN